MILGLDKPDQAAPETIDDTHCTEFILLSNRAGLYTRPAAVLGAKAKKFEAGIHIVQECDKANAKSVIAIMGLATQFNDGICTRPAAETALQALTILLTAGCSEKA